MAVTAHYERLWAQREPGEGLEFAVLGQADAAQVLVPLDNASVTAACFLRHHAGMARRERLKRRAAAVGARLRVLQPLLRERIRIDRDASPSLHTDLEAILGMAPLSLSVAFGPPRPNQKPVIRVLSSKGETVAYAKVGWNPLTVSLVEAEATAVIMPAVRSLDHVSVPELIHLGDWNGFRIAVYSPIPGRPGRTRPSREAFREVATAWPTSRQSLASASLTSHLRANLAGAWSGAVIDAALSRWGDIEMEFGGWHGDWTPWNTAARTGGGVVVWDWERATSGVPTIFDMIHYRFQARSPGYGAADLLAEVASWKELRHGFSRDELQAAAVWYLLTMSDRHAGNAHLTHVEELARALGVGSWTGRPKFSP